MDEVWVQALGRVTAWQAGLDGMTSWAFLSSHFNDWVHCFISGFLSPSCSCGVWELGRAFEIPFLIPIKCGFSGKDWGREEGLPLAGGSRSEHLRNSSRNAHFRSLG